MTLALWIILATLQYLHRIYLSNIKINSEHFAMIIAHIGVAVFALGVTINKSYSEERQVKIKPGESTILAGYQFTFRNLKEVNAANYLSQTATFSIQKNKKPIKIIEAEQRVYRSHQQTLSRPGITFNAFRDLYLALGTPFPDGGWSLRLYYKPAVRWIWVGGFMIVMGGLLSLLSHFKKRGNHHANA